MLSFTRRCRRARLHFGKATPITGTLRAPRRASAYSAGKIILCARSPVTPKSTRASEREAGISPLLSRRRLSPGGRRTRSAARTATLLLLLDRDSGRYLTAGDRSVGAWLPRPPDCDRAVGSRTSDAAGQVALSASA